MDVIKIDITELDRLLLLDEDHFNDFKSKRVSPAKLQEALVAFANSDGGDIYVGVEDKKVDGERVVGFVNQEEANAILTVLLESTVPSVENLLWEFFATEANGLILHLGIPKSPKVHYTATGDCYIRVNAQKNKIKGERITQLGYSKGAELYERKIVDDAELSDLVESEVLKSYMGRVSSHIDPLSFLRKQGLLTKRGDERLPNVAGVLIFNEEPQATLQTRCAVKVYRLRTTDSEYQRAQLEGMPVTITGAIEKVISGAIAQVARYIEEASFMDGGKTIKMQYPAEALKEILVNAVTHRDYSLNDDVHVRVFDNRVEVQSPGRLPGYMTIENLYEDRFSRNPNIVRMLHNLPNPVNHDIGEGLDTAKNELKKAGLVAPSFEEISNAFVVTVRHQKIASIEDVIEKYLGENPDAVLNNRLIRVLSGEDDMQKVKKTLQRMRKDGRLKVVDENASAFNYGYIKG